MALRAVVFDYGMVLSGPPHPEVHDELKRITGLSHEAFERSYWTDRLAYDRGELTGLAFWQKLVSDAGLGLSAEEVAQLNYWDARMWTTVNEETLLWHKQLKEQGLLTGILSNMGDSVLEIILEKFEQPPLPIHIVYPTSRLLSAKVRAFIDLVTEISDWHFGEA